MMTPFGAASIYGLFCMLITWANHQNIVTGVLVCVQTEYISTAGWINIWGHYTMNQSYKAMSTTIACCWLVILNGQ